MSNLQIITPTDLQSAGAVLNQNTSYVEKYQNKSEILLKKAQADGVKLSPETDEDINKFLVSAKTALKKMEEDRKPFTSKLQEAVKLFTAQENKLKDEIYPKLQAVRDASVTAYAKEEAERRRLEQLELDKAKERVQLLADAEQQLRNAYADILAEDKGMLTNAFENADADNINEVEDILKNCDPKFTQEQFDEIVLVLSPQYITISECDVIKEQAKSGKLEKIQSHYTAEIKNHANYLLTLIPQRRKEIEAGEASKAAEELRRKEAQALAAQQAEAERRAEEEASKRMAEVVLDSQIQQAERKASIPDAKAIESYSITVLKREGWAEIFKFYFTHSGAGVDELGSIKLDQMKAYAERQAKSAGLKIESDALEYEIKYKATARAKKAVKA